MSITIRHQFTNIEKTLVTELVDGDKTYLVNRFENGGVYICVTFRRYSKYRTRTQIVTNTINSKGPAGIRLLALVNA